MTKVVNIKEGSQSGVYIGRGSKWGNPFKIGKDGNREEVIEKFREYASGRWSDEELSVLKGQFLKCFCKPLACHGDVLVELVEEAWNGTL